MSSDLKGQNRNDGIGPTLGRIDVASRSLAAVLAIVLVGAVLRLWGLGAESLWFDEIVSATVIAERGLEYILLQLPSEDPHPPLYYAVLKLWSAVAGTSEAGLRSLSVLADLGSIALTYAVARRLFDRRVGLLSALLFALSPFYVWYAREARMYALVTLFALASMYFLLVLVRKEETALRNGWSYVVATVALCYAHAFGPLVVLAQNVYLADGLLNRGYVGGLLPRRWLKLQAIVGAAIVPYYVELAVQTFGGSLGGFVSWIPGPTLSTPWKILGSYVGRAVPPASPNSRFSLWQVGGTDLSIVGELVTFLALAVAVYAIVSYLRREDDSEGITPEPFLLAWLLVPFLGLVLVTVAVTSVVWDRYTAMFGVAFLILLARGLALPFESDRLLSRSLGPDRGTMLVAGVVVLVLAVPLAGLHTDTQKQPWREAVDYVESNAAGGDVVLVSPYWSDTAYEYYADRTLEVTGVRADANPGRVAEVTGGTRVVWLVAGFTTDTDHGSLLSALRDLGYEVQNREPYTDLAVYRLERSG